MCACRLSDRTTTQLIDIGLFVDSHPGAGSTDDANCLLLTTDDVAAPWVPRVVVLAVRHLRAVVCKQRTDYNTIECSRLNNVNSRSLHGSVPYI